jgi:hypothetical protein
MTIHREWMFSIIALLEPRKVHDLVDLRQKKKKLGGWEDIDYDGANVKSQARGSTCHGNG